MLAAITRIAKARLPFIIATGGEFIALYFWLVFFDMGSYVWATAVLWFGFLVERIAVLYWVRVNFGANRGIASDKKTWWQKLIGLLLICLSEITVWVTFVLVYDWVGIWPAFAVLFIGEQLEHSMELALLSKKSFFRFLFSFSATLITAMEALGGLAWLYLVRHDQPQLGGAMMLLALTVEHVIQGDAIKKKFQAAEAQRKAEAEQKADESKLGIASTTGLAAPATDAPASVSNQAAAETPEKEEAVSTTSSQNSEKPNTSEKPDTSKKGEGKEASVLSPTPVIGGAIAVVLASVFFGLVQGLCFELVEPDKFEGNVITLDQNWEKDERAKFYHLSQGTVMMKTEWFLALEQPHIKFVGSNGLLSDPSYLSRFNFLPGQRDDKLNPLGLPVGFAVSDVVMPDSGKEQNVVGLTCAACHTGELQFKEYRFRVDGGVSLVDTRQFENAVGASFLLTLRDPFRFSRFAKRVLGDDHTDEAQEALKTEMSTLLEKGLKQKEAVAARELYDGHDGGYGRTDALAKIGNFVFGSELNEDNLRIGDAPVRFPPLWDSPWFDWSQYNGSVEQPMVRNIGEALGVRARVNLDPTSDRYMQSTVDVEGLHRIETLLAGEKPLQGLTSPKWPDELGAINELKAREGAELYESLCQSCHLPPLQSDEIWNDKYWISNAAPSMADRWVPPAEERKFLNLQDVNLGVIGTDPGQATNFFKRYVNTGAAVFPSVELGMYRDHKWEAPENLFKLKEDSPHYDYPESTMPVGTALQKITVAIAQNHYDEKGYDAATREKYNGYRNPGAVSPLGYRPRPLNGIWASPPYLHNGSVRTIYQLLSPESEREDTFYVGTREYDPEHLGYKNKRVRGAFLYDTLVSGNLNTGHVFDADSLGQGVIGPKLSPDERMQIIEFLKSLGPAKSTEKSTVQ